KKHLLFDRSSKLVQMSVSYLFPVPFFCNRICFSDVSDRIFGVVGFESDRIFGVVGFESDRFSVL
ncbi:hypothetical protein MEO94_32275, partial [Dolichospermum sp. ST_sed9]|nr:hypothetical protein [Dolichospermum sp. ST_sed9]